MRATRRNRRAVGKYLCFIIILWLVLQEIAVIFGLARGVVASDSFTEDQVKAAFVYNFFKFVEWPQTFDKNKAIHLCVVGKKPLTALLESLDGRKIRDSSLRVILDKRLSDLDGCNVLFFISAGNNEKGLEKFLQKLQFKPVLTISDKEGFIYHGGMIELFKKDNKIRFKVNLGAARAANLKISSRLLKLAEEVIE